MDDEAIFFAALERVKGPERAAYLDDACAGDLEQRRRIAELLAAHASSGILDEPAVGPRTGWAINATSETAGQPVRPAVLDEAIRQRLQPPQRSDSLGRLDHYEILEVLGRGGFGVVVKAFDERLHRVAALKIFSPDLAANGTARLRFLREARSAAAVRDEHVVTVYAVSRDDDPLPYLAMELIVGQTLQSKIEKSGPLAPRDVLRIGSQIAKGLAAAHATGLIHRDVKPANVLLENSVERVKLTDFGLARAVDDASLSQTGIVVGTPMYMSPEQARGEAIDHRSDLFSLGSVLYMMTTGRPPFRAAASQAVLDRVCNETPRPVREIEPSVPEWLAAVIEKLHAKDPSERFQTAQETADLLTRYLAEWQLHGEVVAPVKRRRVWPAWVTWVAGASAAAALLTILAAPPVRWPQPTPEPAPIPEPPATEPHIPIAARLRGREQLDAVLAELTRLNPGFDDGPSHVKGWYQPQPTIVDGRLWGLNLELGDATDLSPLRELRDLHQLILSKSSLGGESLDLSPIRNLPLRGLSLAYNARLSDVRALAGLKLEHCDLSGTAVRDIEVLRPMPLKVVLLLGAPVKDLSPLAGKRLERLSLTPSLIGSYSTTGIPVASAASLACRIRELPPDGELERLGVREFELYDVDLERDAERLLQLRGRVKMIDWQPAGPVYDQLDALRNAPTRPRS
ncbi:MAG TPA: serine/threonine-protein kinase [Pirellulales bacterium]